MDVVFSGDDSIRRLSYRANGKVVKTLVHDNSETIGTTEIY